MREELENMAYEDRGRGVFKRDRDSGGNAGTMGDALQKKVGLGDDGKIEVFGKSIDLGLPPELAVFIRPAVTQALAYVSLKGASTAGKFGTSVAGTVGVQNKNHAAQVGRAAYYTWLYGLSTADVLLSLKKTVQEGFKDMHDLRAKAQPLLATENDKEVSLSKALTSKSTMLADARSKVWQDFKHNLWGTGASAVRVLPTMFMAANQAHLDEIVQPERVLALKRKKNMTAPENKELTETYIALREKQMPKGKWQELREKMKGVVAEMKRPDPHMEIKEAEREIKELEKPVDPQQMQHRARFDNGRNGRYESPENAIGRLNARVEDLQFEASLNQGDENKQYKRLLGAVKVDDYQHHRQMALIKDLKEIGGIEPTEEFKGKNFEAARKQILDELKKIRTPYERALQAKLNELKKVRADHLKDLSGVSNSVSSSQDKKDENAVMDAVHWMGDSGARERMFRGNDNYGIDYKKNIQNLMPLPYVAGVVGDIVDRKISNKKAPDTALYKVFALEAYLGRHHHPDRDQVAVDVKDIFKQYLKDRNLNYKLSGTAYEEAVGAITDAIVDKKLHAQALANIVDDKKIVSFNKDDADFGDVKDVKQQLDILLSKYSCKVGEKEIYKDAPFTKETLAATFKDMPNEEKPFFTMLFPPGVLEKAGVPRDEVAKYREEGTEGFAENLADKLRLLIGAGHDEIRKQGVKGKYINAIESLEPAFRTADRDGEASDFIRDNLKDTVKAVRNVEASAKKPGEMWKDFIARSQKAEELQAKTPMEQARRESGDEMQVGV